MPTKELDGSFWLLKIVYGLVPVVAGLDKFTNLLTNWEHYLSPLIARAIPASLFMHVVGVVEIVVGFIVLSRFTRLGAYLVSLWLLGIVLNLLTTGNYYDIAVRDFTMACGAYTLARMEEARERRAPKAPGRPITGRGPLHA